MNNSRLSKIAHIADLVICSTWLLLLTHEDTSVSTTNLLIWLYPALRIWISFLMRRQSKMMLVPIVFLALLTSCIFLDRSPQYPLFVKPWETLLTSACALLSIDSVSRIELHELLGNECRNIITTVASVWLVIYPLVVFIYKKTKKRLSPGTMGIWKCAGLCAYIFGCTLVTSIVLSVSYATTLGIAMLAFMLILIPAIFYHNNIKEMFTRGEVAYFVTFAMFTVGYVCGIGLELKSSITVCTLPAAFFALTNWYVRRDTTYNDILLIVGASVVFWCAQYTTNVVRISMLLLSLALMAVVVIRFAIDTKKKWASVGLYVTIALIMPLYCIGYNPYSVLEASRAWHFDKYNGSPNGILYVRAGDTVGLRDRYGVILPVDRYNWVELLTPSKPYCKVRQDDKWQIYDIERQELVSNEWFEDVIPCGEYVYRLKSQNGDKYLSLPWSYNPYEEQTAKIVDEMPVKNEE